MAEGGIGNQSPSTLFQARLLTTDGVGSNLRLAQYAGNKVVVSGLTVAIPQTGLDRDVADNLIDATGADAGAPPAASTLYYVYISNKRSPFSPESIRLSATAPSYVNGVKYLGSSGNALNWRFVGWVQPNATPEFESTPQNRLIVNQYNRFRLRLYSPGSGLFTSTSTTYVEVDPAGSLTVSFISNGEDSVRLCASAALSADGATIWGCGLGIDGAAAPDPTGYGGRGGLGIIYTNPGQKELELAEGAHEATMLYCNTGGNTLAASPTDILGGGQSITYVEGSLYA